MYGYPSTHCVQTGQLVSDSSVCLCVCAHTWERTTTFLVDLINLETEQRTKKNTTNSRTSISTCSHQHKYRITMNGERKRYLFSSTWKHIRRLFDRIVMENHIVYVCNALVACYIKLIGFHSDRITFRFRFLPLSFSFAWSFLPSTKRWTKRQTGDWWSDVSSLHHRHCFPPQSKRMRYRSNRHNLLQFFFHLLWSLVSAPSSVVRSFYRIHSSVSYSINPLYRYQSVDGEWRDEKKPTQRDEKLFREHIMHCRT